MNTGKDNAVSEDKRLLELLSDLEAALEDHSYALAAARKPRLTPEERLAVVRASKTSWQRLEAAQRALDGLAAQKR
jgi:hypothetical protein